MTVEYIRYKIDPAQKASFIEAYANACVQLNASEHCNAYELTECEDEEGQFMLRIEWTSTEEHLNGFRKSNLFPLFFNDVRPFFNNIQEMRHYKPTELVRRKR